MKAFYEFIGEGERYEITITHMIIRGILVFFFAIFILRLSGRRTFGMKSPFDNVISILLGAILSRAVVGDSPFFATIWTAAVIGFMHRIVGIACFHNSFFGAFMKGSPFVIYENGELNKDNMRRCQISEKDFEEGVRMAGLDNCDLVKIAYVERNGSISVVKKGEEEHQNTDNKVR